MKKRGREWNRVEEGGRERMRVEWKREDEGGEWKREEEEEGGIEKKTVSEYNTTIKVGGTLT